MKNEQELIKIRKQRARKLNCVVYEEGIAMKILNKAWFTLFNQLDDDMKSEVNANLKIIKHEEKPSKVYDGFAFLFGEFVGKPKGQSAIVVYMKDIFVANYFQKDLIEAHTFYVIEHELKHYLGATHEDMESFKNFNYPL